MRGWLADIVAGIVARSFKWLEVYHRNEEVREGSERHGKHMHFMEQTPGSRGDNDKCKKKAQDTIQSYNQDWYSRN